MEHTRSNYIGDYCNGRMEGQGCYEFPPTIQTKYIGEMRDGMFHGKGTLHFINGSKYTGTWEKGKIVEGAYVLHDGLEYKENDWEYCNMDDRRFFTEVQNGLRPAGRSQLTNQPTPALLHSSTYDCGDGFYDPISRQVSDYKSGSFVRNTDQEEHKWILAKCRKSWDENVGYQQKKDLPDLPPTNLK